ncbi:hypothetical protein IV203_037255 [Nitzschia inconspicua]|uniref:Uncharacterized protein n=1 Tax=Nitzschia inconspicua TaxID=303405 RepID=A0A9K3LLU0_9STRA|nr:hypothetical protein IV203_006577 [Nitzschia inconspicua]KAG7364053.1 hypothetical protein IV203_037255 [Nitzschia inconspicua]
MTTTWTTESSLPRPPSHQWYQPMTRLAFQPFLASGSGVVPSSLLNFSQPAMAGVAFPFSTVQQPADASLGNGPFALSPLGTGFGAIEAANALMGLSTSDSGDGSESEGAASPILDLTA